MSNRLWVTVALAATAATSAAAQGPPVSYEPSTAFGVIGGVNVAKYDGTTAFPSRGRAGPIAGLFGRWHANRPLGIEADLGLVQDRAKFTIDGGTDGFD